VACAIVAFAGLAVELLAGCSAGDSDPGSTPSFQDGAGPGTPGNAAAAAGASAQPGAGGSTGGDAAGTGVGNYDRPLGMPIGQGASGNEEAPGARGDTALDPGQTPAASDDEIEIPVFEAGDDGPPCSGCVELQVLVNDINQRDDFVLDAGGMTGVTRVIWTIVVPFNSDQLFVQPFVDNVFGTYTDLDANAFAIDTPVQLEQTLPAAVAAGSIGLALGSSGAWTGDMVMSLFVDAVTIEANGASASRSFETSVEGLAARTNAHQPQVVYHP
jgi:hypothetical protein